MMPPLQRQDWARVRAEIDRCIDQARRHLENPGNDLPATNFWRGRIRALRDLIAWGEPENAGEAQRHSEAAMAPLAPYTPIDR